MKQRVITLHQPYATLIAEGYKRYEFRSKKYNYRGKILIHAGKGIDKEAMERVKELNLEYPQSQIVAEVEIIDCIKVDDKLNDSLRKQNNLAYGQSNHEGYAWCLDNIKKIKNNKKYLVNKVYGILMIHS